MRHKNKWTQEPEKSEEINIASEEQQTNEAPADSAESTNAHAEKPIVLARVLKVKTPPMTGTDVQAVQRELERLRLKCGADTERKEYSSLTAKAVRRFQVKNHLSPSGWVDKNTAHALGIAWAGKP